MKSMKLSEVTAENLAEVKAYLLEGDFTQNFFTKVMHEGVEATIAHSTILITEESGAKVDLPRETVESLEALDSSLEARVVNLANLSVRGGVPLDVAFETMIKVMIVCEVLPNEENSNKYQELFIDTVKNHEMGMQYMLANMMGALDNKDQEGAPASATLH